MKTAIQCIKMELGYDDDLEIDLDQISRNLKYLEKAMKLYAEQFIDAAVELGHDFVVDVEDIIKLKEQLK